MDSPSACINSRARTFMLGEPANLAFLRQQPSEPCWLYRAEFYDWIDDIDLDCDLEHDGAAVMTSKTSKPGDGPQDVPDLDALENAVDKLSLASADSPFSRIDSGSAQPSNTDSLGDYEAPAPGPTERITTTTASYSGRTETASTLVSRKTSSNVSKRPPSERIKAQIATSGSISQHGKVRSAKPATSTSTQNTISTSSKARNKRINQVQQPDRPHSDTLVNYPAITLPPSIKPKIKVTCIDDLNVLERRPDHKRRPVLTEYPDLLHELHSTLSDIRRSDHIIPLEVKHCPEVKSHLGIADVNKSKVFKETTSSLGPGGAAAELANILRIILASNKLSQRGSIECSWNFKVHWMFLDLLHTYYDDVRVEGVTDLKPQPRYIPKFGLQETEAKLVDFVFLWEPSSADRDVIVDNLLTPEHLSINHVITKDTDYRQCPFVIPVETKQLSGDQQMALAQIVLWAMTQFARFRQITNAKGINDAVFTFPIPMLMVIGDRWTLYFAVDGKSKTKIIEFGEIGSTSSLEDAYKLLESLKALVLFVRVRWVPLFRDEVMSA